MFHEDDVGAVLPGQPQRLRAVGGLPHHLHVPGSESTSTRNALRSECLVVREQDADGHTVSPWAVVVLTGRIAWTRKPPP